MPEADAEDRLTAEQLAHDGDLIEERLRIARPVREQHAVEPLELLARRVVRKNGHRRTGAGEPPQDRALAAVVDDRDPRPPRLGVHVRTGRRHTGCQRTAAHRRLCPRNGDRLVDRSLAGDDDGSKGTGLPQLQHE